MKSIREILPGETRRYSPRDCSCSMHWSCPSPDPNWTMWAAQMANRRPVCPGCTDIAGNRDRRNRAGHVGGRNIWNLRGGGSSGAGDQNVV